MSGYQAVINASLRLEKHAIRKFRATKTVERLAHEIDVLGT
jgi:hypothetical protein